MENWKIKYIQGDLVRDAERDFDVIGHGCNCWCTFGAGIALAIKNKYPEAYDVDCKTKSGDRNKLGTISYTKGTVPIIVNLYTQFGYGNSRFGKVDLDYDALRSSLKLVKEKFSGKTFGFPMIGSGLAGGSWDVIEKIIQEEMVDEDVTIVQL